MLPFFVFIDSNVKQLYRQVYSNSATVSDFRVYSLYFDIAMRWAYKCIPLEYCVPGTTHCDTAPLTPLATAR